MQRYTPYVDYENLYDDENDVSVLPEANGAWVLYSEARAEIERLEKEVGRWQPIETAPKDMKESGKPVLLWSPETHTYPLFGRYWTQNEQWEEDCGATYCKPTHWMPLPTPPTETE